MSLEASPLGDYFIRVGHGSIRSHRTADSVPGSLGHAPLTVHFIETTLFTPMSHSTGHLFVPVVPWQECYRYTLLLLHAGRNSAVSLTATQNTTSSFCPPRSRLRLFFSSHPGFHTRRTTTRAKGPLGLLDILNLLIYSPGKKNRTPLCPLPSTTVP